MQGFFVTGTDTNVGKTVVSAWLLTHLDACYWKPVQAGLAGETDAEIEDAVAYGLRKAGRAAETPSLTD